MTDAGTGWTHPAFEMLAGLLRRHAGLAFRNLTVRTAQTSMRDAMAAARIADPWVYAQRAGADPEELARLVDAVTIGETYFFRDLEQFDFLRSDVLPGLRARGGTVRAWSAGCASGEEAYSLAMLFHAEGLADQARVVGTDVSRGAVERARAGRTGRWSLRPPGAGLARPYLDEQADGTHVVREPIARMCTFAELNLTGGDYPSFATGTVALDVILCRNVLLYIDPELAPGILARLVECLAPGGWLLVGPTDPPMLDCAPPGTTVACGGTAFCRAQDAGLARWVFASPAPGGEGAGDEARELEEARAALAQGDYIRAAELARPHASVEAAALRVRALANFQVAAAETESAAALERHPASVELKLLRGMLLARLGRPRAARAALEDALALDPALAVAQFALGAVLLALGHTAGARRAYRRAWRLARALAAGAELPLSDGQTAGWVAASARAQLDILGAAPALRGRRAHGWSARRKGRSGAA